MIFAHFPSMGPDDPPPPTSRCRKCEKFGKILKENKMGPPEDPPTLLFRVLGPLKIKNIDEFAYKESTLG